MKRIDWVDMVEAASRQMNKFIVMVNNHLDFGEGHDKHSITVRLREICSKYSTNECEVIIIPEVDEYFIFDDEQKAREFYKEFECPILSDSVVFASLCSPTQGFLTENT